MEAEVVRRVEHVVLEPRRERGELVLELAESRLLRLRELGAAGARTAEVRGGRLSIVPLELESATVGAIRERIPEAIYELRSRTLSLRVGDEPAERLASMIELTEALSAALAAAEPVAA